MLVLSTISNPIGFSDAFNSNRGNKKRMAQIIPIFDKVK